MNIVKLISDADECNINQFIRCAFKNDLSVLTISGNPSPKQLSEAWENILTEFNDTSGQSQPMEELILLRQIYMLEARIAAMEKFIFADEQAVKLIGRPLEDFSLYHKYGYQIKFNGNGKEFLKELEQIKEAELSYRIDLQDLYDQLDKIKNIELFYKYQINFESYSVKRLAILINDFREMVDRNSMN